MSILKGLHTKPIKFQELLTQLQKIGASRDSIHFRRPKIAVCVSGGADSMALAYMMSRLEHQSYGTKMYDVRAFIVDHGLRTESRDEAHIVKHNLKGMGILSEILTIQWSPDACPSQISGFEDTARIARYKLITTSALKYDCCSLYAGHHRDDNIETLLFRLARGGKPPLSSMLGMSGESSPPCTDIFGAHSYGQAYKPELDYDSRRYSKFGQTIQIDEDAQSGLLLYRPFLNFDKSQILATCSSYGIPFVEDRTNQDPTFATRNAIRRLRSFGLPCALQSRRMLALQQRAHNHVDRIEEAAKGLSDTITHLKLYSRTGTIDMIMDVPQGATDEPSWQYFMARIVEMVSPLMSSFPTLIPAAQLSEIIRDTWACGHNQTAMSDLRRTTLKHVMIQIQKVSYHDKSMLRMIFQRQPIKSLVLPMEIGFETETECNSKYVLWDGRFWVAISCREQHDLDRVRIRAYLPKDIANVKKNLNEQGRLNKFYCALRDAMPKTHAGSSGEPLMMTIRHTLPVLVCDGKVIAFPTLDFQVDGCTLPGLRWKVNYRRAKRVLDFFATHLRTAPETFKHELRTDPLAVELDCRISKKELSK